MKAMIVGAGIGCLTAAIAQRRAGVETTVFERAGELREVGAGLLLAANAVRALDSSSLENTHVDEEWRAGSFASSWAWSGARVSGALWLHTSAYERGVYEVAGFEARTLEEMELLLAE
jgi:2-polyprenyl-6-methoxyphenol hydroxylase-like FAD-dependent oxidoreductase